MTITWNKGLIRIWITLAFFWVIFILPILISLDVIYFSPQKSEIEETYNKILNNYYYNLQRKDIITIGSNIFDNIKTKDDVNKLSKDQIIILKKFLQLDAEKPSSVENGKIKISYIENSNNYKCPQKIYFIL
jgi:hypothetical protein